MSTADPPWRTSALNLASGSNSKVIFATDEWFACADNLLTSGPPTFDPAAFCAQGKVMDGWESRRRRLPGHDWCILRLGLPGEVLGFEVDTTYFTGNQTPRVSIEVACLDVDPDDAWMPGAVARAANGGGVQGTACTPDEVAAAAAAVAAAGEWRTALAMSPLRPGVGTDGVHWFAAAASDGSSRRVTHVRFNYFPDGGVARLRVWGAVRVSFDSLVARGATDLAALSSGGRGVCCSNAHYGAPRSLLQAGRGPNMGDGWETARHPHRPAIIELDPATGLQLSALSDWAVVRLGAVARSVDSLLIDTHHFKGNYPESALVEALYAPAATDAEVEALCASSSSSSASGWFTLLPRTRLSADAEHRFARAGASSGDGDGLLDSTSEGKAVSHVRISIFPDGGIMRLRVVGTAAEPLES